MSYVRGDTANVIVGAAAIFVAAKNATLPAPSPTNASYKEILSSAAEAYDPTTNVLGWTNVGFTSNGLELQFAPEFGEVQVDQLLDVAKMYKSGMTVTLNTSFAEATLENLAFAIATSESVIPAGALYQRDGNPDGTWDATSSVLNVMSGVLGECPVEKQLVAVGAGRGECEVGLGSERVYTAYRVLSIESVTASSKRDEASVFDVSFRLLPDDVGRYGQIVDRTFDPNVVVS